VSRRHTKRERQYWPHSNPEPPPDLVAVVARAVDEHVTLDGTQACVMGCRARGKHLPHCPCQDTCPDHDGHCKGCAPREAHGSSLLCGSCFHRRLRSPLRQCPTVAGWLSSRLGGLRSASLEPGVSGSHEPPVPIDVDVHDHLAVMRVTLAGWARQVAEKSADDGPDCWHIAATAGYLDGRAAWVSEQPWAPDVIASVAGLLNVARGLAPWEAQQMRLEATCDRCGSRSLVQFGGEDWVTCVNRECDNVIGVGRYQNLARSEVRARSKVG
jgi:hypothetical protein